MQVNQNGTMMPTKIKLGDAIKRITFKIYWELKELLISFNNTEADLKTVALRRFVALSKKRLAQLLAVIRWLGRGNVVDLFRSLEQFDRSILEVNNLYACGLDNMFFLHQGLYSMRTMKHEAAIAFNMGALGTYPLLPSAIFSGGMKNFPKEIVAEELIHSLDLYIRMKLALREIIPINSYLSFSLENGILTITNQYYYKLYLTLFTLSIDSRWKVLGFHFHDSILSKFNQKQKGISSTSSSSSTISSDNKKRKQLEDEILNVLQKNENNCLSFLMTILNYCEERSQILRLRNLYIHFIKLLRRLTSTQQLLFQQLYETKLIELKDEFEFQLKFWKSVANNEEFQFLIKLKLSSPSEKETPIVTSELWIPGRNERIHHFHEWIPFHSLIGNNINPEELFALISVKLATKKLSFLYSRFLSLNLPELNVRLEDDCIFLFPTMKLSQASSSPPAAESRNDANESNLSMKIQIDSRSGKFILHSDGMGDFITSCKSAFVRFQEEINNLENNNFFFLFLLQESQEFLDQQKIAVSRQEASSSLMEVDEPHSSSSSMENKLVFPMFSTLPLLIEGLQLIIRARDYLFTKNQFHFLPAIDDERIQFQSLLNDLSYSRRTWILFKVKYWFHKNIYNNKYQWMTNEVNHLHDQILSKNSKGTDLMTNNHTNHSSSLMNDDRPFAQVKHDDNKIKGKAPKTSRNATSTNNNLQKEFFVLYLMVSFQDKSQQRQQQQQPQQPRLSFDFYLTKNEMNPSKNNKLKMNILSRHIQDILLKENPNFLQFPLAYQLSLMDNWILQYLKLDYIPYRVLIRKDILQFRFQEQQVKYFFGLKLSHLVLPMTAGTPSTSTGSNQKSSNKKSPATAIAAAIRNPSDENHSFFEIPLKSGTEKFSFYCAENSIFGEFFVQQQHRKALHLAENTANPSSASSSSSLGYFPIARVRFDFYQIVNPAKIKDEVYIRVFINSLALLLPSTAPSVSIPETLVDADGVCVYDKIKVNTLRFLELLMKKMPIKLSVEFAIINLFDITRAVIIFLWSSLLFSADSLVTSKEGEDDEDADQDEDTPAPPALKYSLRPMTITTSTSDDLPMILMAVDRLTLITPAADQVISGMTSEPLRSSVRAELHSFRYFTFSFEENAILLLDINQNRVNTFPVRDITVDKTIQIVNSIQ